MAEEENSSKDEVVLSSPILTSHGPSPLQVGSSRAKHAMKPPPLSATSKGGEEVGESISTSRAQHYGLCEINPTTNESHVGRADNATVESSREGLPAGRRQPEIISCDSQRLLPGSRRKTIYNRIDESHLVSPLKEVVSSSQILTPDGPSLFLVDDPSIRILNANKSHQKTADLHPNHFKDFSNSNGGGRSRRRSISTPNFCMLDPGVGGGTKFPWNYSRPPLTNRRSLSPERLSFRLIDTEGSFPLRFLSRLTNSSPEQPADLHLNDFKKSRRHSMPEHIQKNLGEVMDSNALRYLPKILRDVYAQRQTRRPSLVSSSFFVWTHFFLDRNQPTCLDGLTLLT
jgi:hypothetical protein